MKISDRIDRWLTKLFFGNEGLAVCEPIDERRPGDPTKASAPYDPVFQAPGKKVSNPLIDFYVKLRESGATIVDLSEADFNQVWQRVDECDRNPAGDRRDLNYNIINFNGILLRCKIIIERPKTRVTTKLTLYRDFSDQRFFT